MRKQRKYVFLGQTTSLCEVCSELVPAKILREGNKVFYQKLCLEHGVQKTLVSTDADYYAICRAFLKPSDIPQSFQSKTRRGCPYDCGLCPDHEQHSCMALIEVNETCNLSCPVCFADSSPSRAGQRTLIEIESMLDCLVESEGEPDLVQISGGEPTLHSQILDILRLAKSKPIRHLMLNTNGIRIARDKAFVDALKEFCPSFEIYLQFDSLRSDTLEDIRGSDLRVIRKNALENLEAAGISTTLVCVLKKGRNDNEVGEIIRHGLQYRCVRGVTFQPVQDVGRNTDFKQKKDRIVLSEIRQAVIEQSGIFTEEDMIPLPCNPHYISIGYGLRQGADVIPVTRWIDREMLLAETPNTITFERAPQLRKCIEDALSLAAVGEQAGSTLRQLLCCLPQMEVPKQIGYESVFRVVIVQFMDRFNFCLGGVKRSCIHFITPEEKIIPFDTYNLFYRDSGGSAQP